MGRKAELLEAARLLFSGQLAPVVDSTFPLERAGDAQERMERRQQFGKIVLEI
jgi:NADPH:quinone reductase-like Zn-dependent oxidoreductase